MSRVGLLEDLESRRLFALQNQFQIDGQSYHGGSCSCGGCRLIRPVDLPVIDVIDQPVALANAGSFRPGAATNDNTGGNAALANTGATANNTAPAGGFDIVINLTGSGVTQAVRNAFQQAEALWESIITADIPDVQGIDDLRIDASIVTIDGVGSVLGQAGPTAVRRGSLLPATGIMQFDTADVQSLISDGSLSDVIFHEMGHVLGIGTIWDMKNLIGGTNANPLYVGSNGIAAYQQLGGSGFGVPLEANGGEGTAFSHWSEEVFGNEILTGFLDSGENLLSTLTIASLGDLGYKGLDLSQADNYSIPGLSSSNDPFHDNPPLDEPVVMGTISGRVFNDTDGDGVFDSNESGMSGRLVFVDFDSDGFFDFEEPVASTDDQGFYEFVEAEPGTYRIRLIVPSGFTPTTPAARLVTINSGGSELDVDFGINTPGGTVTGFVFNDVNRNRKFGRFEQGISGRTVYLDLNNNNVLDANEASSVTDSNGIYRLTGIAPGRYILRQVVPNDSIATTPRFGFIVNARTGRTLVANFGTALLRATEINRRNQNRFVFGSVLVSDDLKSSPSPVYSERDSRRLLFL